MNKTPLLLALCPLLTSCLEPNDQASAVAGGEADTMMEETGGQGRSDDPTDEPDSDPEPSAADCDGSESCLQVTPDGWTRVARFAGSSLAQCGSLGGHGFVAGVDVVADPATCEAECGTPTGGACETETTLEIYEYYTVSGVPFNEFSCQDTTMTASIGTEMTPYAGFFPEGPIWFTAEAPSVAEPGGCEMLPETHAIELPPVEFVQPATFCEGGAELAECGDGAECVPAKGQACVYRVGDHSCPSGDYSAGSVLYAGFEDARTCDVLCGEAEGQACQDATVEFDYSPGGEGTVPADGGCHFLGLPGSIDTNRLDAGTPTGGQCNPTSLAAGDVLAAEQITVCCEA